MSELSLPGQTCAPSRAVVCGVQHGNALAGVRLACIMPFVPVPTACTCQGCCPDMDRGYGHYAASRYQGLYASGPCAARLRWTASMLHALGPISACLQQAKAEMPVSAALRSPATGSSGPRIRWSGKIKIKTKRPREFPHLELPRRTGRPRAKHHNLDRWWTREH